MSKCERLINERRKKDGVLDVTLQILNATDAAAAVTAACPVQMHQHFSGIRRWREKKRRRKEKKKKKKKKLTSIRDLARTAN